MDLLLKLYVGVLLDGLTICALDQLRLAVEQSCLFFCSTFGLLDVFTEQFLEASTVGSEAAQESFLRVYFTIEGGSGRSLLLAALYT